MSEQGLGASGREEKLAFTGTPRGGGACVPGRGLARAAPTAPDSFSARSTLVVDVHGDGPGALSFQSTF